METRGRDGWNEALCWVIENQHLNQNDGGECAVFTQDLARGRVAFAKGEESGDNIPGRA